MKTYAWDVAKDHVGETATVTGPVVRASKGAGSALFELAIGKDPAKTDPPEGIIAEINDLTGFPQDLAGAYLNKKISVTAKIEQNGFTGAIEMVRLRPSPSDPLGFVQAPPAVKPPASPTPVAADTTVVPLTGLDIPNPQNLTSWTIDSMVIDQATHLLYVTNLSAKEIEVFDVSTKNAVFVKAIPTTGGAPGLEIVKSLNKLFAAVNDGTVAVIDINPASQTKNTVVSTIKIGKDPLDGVTFIPGYNKLYCTSNNKGSVAVVDLASNTVTNLITGLGIELEPASYNPNDKMVYLANTDLNVLYKFDPSSDKQVAKIDIVDEADPTHIAIKSGSNLAVIASENKDKEHTVIWDFSTQKVASAVNNVGVGDYVIYDQAADRFFLASTNFSRGSCIGIFDGKCKFLTNVPTGVKGGHSVAFDETNSIVYTTETSVKLQLVSFPLPNITSGASSPAASAPAGNTITWKQALLKENLGKTFTVTGPVAQAAKGFGGSFILTLGAEAPDGVNCEIINPKLFPDADLAAKYMGKNVAVTGKLAYNDHLSLVEITPVTPQTIQILP